MKMFLMTLERDYDEDNLTPEYIQAKMSDIDWDVVLNIKEVK